MGFLKLRLLWLCQAIAIPGVLCDGHGGMPACKMDDTMCEFYLEVSTWLPMRTGFDKKTYINDTDSMVYTHGDATNTPVNLDDVVLADGSIHDRVLMLFNQTMPGPTLTVYVGQEVLVHVTNHLISNSISIHFHGIEMRGTPWMDGAAFVTQCPISPGLTFTYRFTADRSGTYFYHSHTGAHVSDGMFGAFIVKENDVNEMQEHVMFIQDYNNIASSDHIYTAGVVLGTFTPDGVPVLPRPRSDGFFSPPLQITSSLINGRGRVLDKDGNHLTKTPLSVFSVKQGTSYRFRVIGGGYGYQHQLSIDGHTLNVVATDGNDIEPVRVDSVMIHTGERFDIIVDANKAGGNFWIRAENMHDTKELTGLAILRYEGANEEDPTFDSKECTNINPCLVLNCPFETYPNWNCIPADKMRAKDTSDPAPAANSGTFKEFFINTGYAMGEKYFVGHMNGVQLKLPTVSALTQPGEVTGFCEGFHNCGPDKVCHCIRPLNVNFGDVVQITFLSAGIFNTVNHPIHVHGYSFHVLKIGYRQGNASFTDDINCATPLCYSDATWSDQSWNGGNLPNVDYARAPRKDTVVLPGGGYVVIRFVADNPGLWQIHCHMEFHNQMGMGILLNDSFSRIPAPPAGMPECRNFPPPDWVVSPPTTEMPSTKVPSATCRMNELYCLDRRTCATFCNGVKECDGEEDETNCPATMTEKTDKRTFSEEEFWGMFGALMFVVLLQFVIAMSCSRRTKESFKL